MHRRAKQFVKWVKEGPLTDVGEGAFFRHMRRGNALVVAPGYRTVQSWELRCAHVPIVRRELPLDPSRERHCWLPVRSSPAVVSTHFWSAATSQVETWTMPASPRRARTRQSPFPSRSSPVGVSVHRWSVAPVHCDVFKPLPSADGTTARHVGVLTPFGA